MRAPPVTGRAGGEPNGSPTAAAPAPRSRAGASLGPGRVVNRTNCPNRPAAGRPGGAAAGEWPRPYVAGARPQERARTQHGYAPHPTPRTPLPSGPAGKRPAAAGWGRARAPPAGMGGFAERPRAHAHARRRLSGRSAARSPSARAPPAGHRTLERLTPGLASRWRWFTAEMHNDDVSALNERRSFRTPDDELGRDRQHVLHGAGRRGSTARTFSLFVFATTAETLFRIL